MAIIGFDISKNGTGVCVRPDKGKILLYTYTKHLPKKCLRFVHENDDFIVIAEQIQVPEGSDDFEVLRHITSHIFEQVFTYFDKDNSFYAEGYSMGGNGRITMLAEMTALIKDSIYRLGHKINGLYAPTSIKKEIGGHGRIEKPEIYERCWDNKALKQTMNEIEAKGHAWKKSSCWQSDVLDAFAVTEMGIKKTGEIIK